MFHNKNFSSRTWLCFLGVVMSVSACKPFSQISSLSLKSKEICLLNQSIKTLEIHINVPNYAVGNVFYNYEFSEGFYIPHWGSMNRSDDTAVYSDRTAGTANGDTIIGDHIKEGLSIKDKFKYLKADFRTECLAEADLQTRYPEGQWPSSPGFTVEVNGRYLFQGPAPTPTTTTLDCTEETGKKYKKVEINIPAETFRQNSFYQKAARC